MRKVIWALLSFSIPLMAFSDESCEAKRYRRGQAAGYATRDATVLSMMGWGLGIAIGIAVLCALIENNAGSSASSSGSP